MKTVFLFLTILLSTNLLSIKINPSQSKDFVPNEETAIRIAEAIWLPIYGESVLEEKPFYAVLKDSIWIVKGSSKKLKLGGVAYIEIRKSDCKILKVTHGK